MLCSYIYRLLPLPTRGIWRNAGETSGRRFSVKEEMVYSLYAHVWIAVEIGFYISIFLRVRAHILPIGSLKGNYIDKVCLWVITLYILIEK
jgi:hypothetical protein